MVPVNFYFFNFGCTGSLLWCGLFVAAHGLLSSCGMRAPGRTGSLVVARGLSCPEACGILVPWPGIEPTSPALEGGFLTTGPSGKSLPFNFVLILSSLLPFLSLPFSPQFFLLLCLLAIFLRLLFFFLCSFGPEQGLTCDLCSSPARTSQVIFTISTLPMGSPCGTIPVMNTIGTWWSKSGGNCQLLGPIRRKKRKRKRKRKTRRTKRPPKVPWWVSGCQLSERPGLKPAGYREPLAVYSWEVKNNNNNIVIFW